MFNDYADKQYALYHSAREELIKNPQRLIELEKFVAHSLSQFVQVSIGAIESDYNEATYTHPFWKNYPPEDRGRAPKHDQYPWIEVGEQTIGPKLTRYFDSHFETRDAGLPSGSDFRVIIKHEQLKAILGFTDSAWIFVDIKSVGPRDKADHAVMSPYQISGNGNWLEIESGVENTPVVAQGKLREHKFYSSLAPLYVLSDETIVPLVTCIVKPVYRMETSSDKSQGGQPLEEITTAIIPNGLLLSENPCYLEQHPGLFFPGKDDKSKDERKMRARVSFNLLKKIDPWRVQTFKLDGK